MGQRAAQRQRRGVVSTVVGGFGEILLTAGLVLLLFVVWQLWWTNIEADAVQKDAITEVTEDWGNAKDGVKPTQPLEGKVWGILYVPRFGDGYAKPIAEGTSDEIMNTIGVGHYPSTQLPGELGNVAMAGHRQTHGQVFWDMDKLKDGDKAYVQTAEGIWTYTFTSRTIVSPATSSVLLPVPGKPNEEPSISQLTLTTCDPPFTTRMRMIVHMEQTAESGPGEVPGEIADIVKKTTGVEEGE
ncbi:MAG: class E sortase [Galactobacter sp.]